MIKIEYVKMVSPVPWLLKQENQVMALECIEQENIHTK